MIRLVLWIYYKKRQEDEAQEGMVDQVEDNAIHQPPAADFAAAAQTSR